MSRTTGLEGAQLLSRLQAVTALMAQMGDMNLSLCLKLHRTLMCLAVLHSVASSRV